jgi:uncharacterized protein
LFLLDNRVVYSPTDLAIATQCEFALLRRLDAKLGRGELQDVDDPLMARAAVLGEAHEQRVLEAYKQCYGGHTPGTRGGVALFTSRPEYASMDALVAARDAALRAMSDKADVVYQASFFDGRFYGRSDFIVRTDDTYQVLDTKLSKHAKVTALLQLAAYADQLLRHGIPLNAEVGLIPGKGEPRHFAVRELLAVYRHRRARLEEILDRHHAATGPVAWDDPIITSCGRCEECNEQIQTRRDVLLVAGMRVSQRVRLNSHGVKSIEGLAASTGPVPGIGTATLDRLRKQAALQCVQDGLPRLAHDRPDVQSEVFDEAPIRRLPPPDPGDIFFDFEGDPLWDAGDEHSGLEYLFGLIEADTGDFVPLVAHDRAQEKQALVDFLGYVEKRRAERPGMHIYHYAAYERSALTRLAGRYQVGEDQVDNLLRGGVLIDLYATVRASVRVSQPSYSIKKLEPLYMGDELRTSVDNAADSVVAYARYTDLVEAEKVAEAQATLETILDYNRYDCLSTLKLRDWLRKQVSSPDRAAVPAKADQRPAAPDPLVEELLAKADAVEKDDPNGLTLRMLAACLGYHQREEKPFWWAHFARLREPIEDWSDSKDVFVVDEVLQGTPWEQPHPRKLPRRTLRLAGVWGIGSVPSCSATPVYEEPLPDGFQVPADGCRASGSSGALVHLPPDDKGRDVVDLELRVSRNQPEYDNEPVALVPDPGPNTATLRAALRDLAVAAASGTLPNQPGVALLRRLTEADGQPPLRCIADDASSEERIAAVVEAVRRRAGAYVAVQGPPGTGKTFLGSHVVKALIAEGWHIGVVAQSHSVVGHFLDACIEAGVPAEQVGQNDRGRVNKATSVGADSFGGFLAKHKEWGCIIGGTAWDFVNPGRVGRGELDLLVVDEAGQFCVANTLAASVAAQRLLLLGDPRQLPQVSQGTHPEPVDGSALGWLMDGSATLWSELGYFLPVSWRMDPALCSKVSELSYDGRLRSHTPATDPRHLEGIGSGLHAVPIHHRGNAVCSTEEAAEVVRIAKTLIGRTWKGAADEGARSLSSGDVLVVAAYNAQVNEIRRQLVQTGLGDVLVGTVDKVQGREAPVCIVSLAASSPAEAPRGMDFLLSRNRLNVAISRGKWATYLVHSPALADFLPATPVGLQALGAFLALL